MQYSLTDYNNEEIKGKFYGLELQKVHPPERFRIERVIKQLRRRVGRGVQYFVK